MGRGGEYLLLGLGNALSSGVGAFQRQRALEQQASQQQLQNQMRQEDRVFQQLLQQERLRLAQQREERLSEPKPPKPPGMGADAEAVFNQIKDRVGPNASAATIRREFEKMGLPKPGMVPQPPAPTDDPMAFLLGQQKQGQDWRLQRQSNEIDRRIRFQKSQEPPPAVPDILNRMMGSPQMEANPPLQTNPLLDPHAPVQQRTQRPPRVPPGGGGGDGGPGMMAPQAPPMLDEQAFQAMPQGPNTQPIHARSAGYLARHFNVIMGLVPATPEEHLVAWNWLSKNTALGDMPEEVKMLATGMGGSLGGAP